MITKLPDGARCLASRLIIGKNLKGVLLDPDSLIHLDFHTHLPVMAPSRPRRTATPGLPQCVRADEAQN